MIREGKLTFCDFKRMKLDAFYLNGYTIINYDYYDDGEHEQKEAIIDTKFHNVDDWEVVGVDVFEDPWCDAISPAVFLRSPHGSHHKVFTLNIANKISTLI